jgi:hypothetical protein
MFGFLKPKSNTVDKPTEAFGLLKYNPIGKKRIGNKPTEEFGTLGVKLESDRSTVSTDRSTVSTDRSSVSNDYTQEPNTADPFEKVIPIDPETARKAEMTATREAEITASRQKRLALEQQHKEELQRELKKKSENLASDSKESFQRIEKVDRILAFFSPTYHFLTAVPIIGEILDTAGEFIVKFKEDRKLIAIGDLLFKNTDQMFAKIAEMEKLYAPSSPVTIATSQRGGKSTPKEFIELIELLEELYITLLSMVLTEERVNLIAKQLMANEKYSYMDPDCGTAVLNFSGLNCSFNDKLLAYIDSRQTIQNKIGDKNVNTNASSWVFRKLKTAGKTIYRYGIAGEMIVQLQQLNTFVNTSFNIALAQYVLDVKDELETTIQQIKATADEAVKKAEESINIVSIRQSISAVQTDIINRDSSAAGGRRTMKKRGENKQKKQKFGKTRRTRA